MCQVLVTTSGFHTLCYCVPPSCHPTLVSCTCTFLLKLVLIWKLFSNGPECIANLKSSRSWCCYIKAIAFTNWYFWNAFSLFIHGHFSQYSDIFLQWKFLCKRIQVPGPHHKALYCHSFYTGQPHWISGKMPITLEKQYVMKHRRGPLSCKYIVQKLTE